MPLHGIGHSRSQSHSANAPVPDQPFASLVQAASQTLTGIGNPAALGGGGATNTSTSRPANNANSGLRLQTSNTVSAPGSQQNSGITPIQSGGSSTIISPDSAQPPKKSISFRLPSPDAQPGPSDSSRPQQQQQQQRLSQQEQLYQDHSSSATQSHPHHLSQRPSDPIQKQQLSSQQPTAQPTYTAYHSANPSSNTGSRPHISSTTTAPTALPQASQQRSPMHRTNTSGGGGGGGGGYSPNAQLTPGGGGDVSSRKYNHPGALTPTYPSSSQHTTSHSNSGVGNQGIGLTNSSSNSMREPQEISGAVGPGRWMCPYGLYAIDWCKWNPSASGGYGRVAIGSYAEDSHNYVGAPPPRWFADCR